MEQGHEVASSSDGELIRRSARLRAGTGAPIPDDVILSAAKDPSGEPRRTLLGAWPALLALSAVEGFALFTLSPSKGLPCLP